MKIPYLYGIPAFAFAIMLLMSVSVHPALAASVTDQYVTHSLENLDTDSSKSISDIPVFKDNGFHSIQLSEPDTANSASTSAFSTDTRVEYEEDILSIDAQNPLENQESSTVRVSSLSNDPVIERIFSNLSQDGYSFTGENSHQYELSLSAENFVNVPRTVLVNQGIRVSESDPTHVTTVNDVTTYSFTNSSKATRILTVSQIVNTDGKPVGDRELKLSPPIISKENADDGRVAVTEAGAVAAAAGYGTFVAMEVEGPEAVVGGALICGLTGPQVVLVVIIVVLVIITLLLCCWLWWGCFDSAPPAPATSFSCTPTQGLSPLTVNCKDSSSNSPTGWSWDFGDGSKSTDQNPTHLYTQSGIYTVGLTASNDGGSSTATVPNYINAVDPSRAANFYGTPRSGVAPLDVQFNDSSLGSPVSWNWDFGDQSESIEQNPKHTYITTGNYSVTLAIMLPGGNGSAIRRLNYTSVTSSVIKFTATVGGQNDDFADISVPTSDKGVLLVGTTKSNIAEFHGNQDIVVAKYGPDYAQQWIHSYGGGSGTQEANYAIQTSDGGYLIVGGTSSNDGDIQGKNHGGYNGTYDVWTIKLKADGSTDWQNCYGGQGSETGMSVVTNTDAAGRETSFIIAGWTESNDGDVSGKHSSSDLDVTRDAWVFNINATGQHEVLWQRCYGGTDDDEAKSMIKSPDGNSLIVAGYSGSGDGDLQGIKTYDSDDAWIFAISSQDPQHKLTSNHLFGGNSLDEALAIQPTPDGGYISTGFTESNDGDITSHHGDTDSKDILVLKLNSDLSKQWIRAYGGSKDDVGAAVRVWPSRNAYYILGSTSSNDYDVFYLNHGGDTGTSDIFLMKIDYYGNILHPYCFGGSNDDFGVRFGDRIDLSGGSYVLGTILSNNGDFIGLNHGGNSGTSDIAVIGF
jgi:PKD repeat protein